MGSCVGQMRMNGWKLIIWSNFFGIFFHHKICTSKLKLRPSLFYWKFLFAATCIHISQHNALYGVSKNNLQKMLYPLRMDFMRKKRKLLTVVLIRRSWYSIPSELLRNGHSNNWFFCWIFTNFAHNFFNYHYRALNYHQI